MQLTPLESILIAGFGSSISGLCGAWIASLFRNRKIREELGQVVTRPECQQMRGECNLIGIRESMRALCKAYKVQTQMLRVLMEKNGISVQQQIELERQYQTDEANLL